MTRDEKIAQAREWKANNWDIDAIADELDVSTTTVRKWVSETYRLACIARVKAWRLGAGREKRNAIVRRYRAKKRATQEANP